MIRTAFYVSALLMVALVATWAYRVVNDNSQLAEDVAELRRDISEERRTIQVLRVEWAWLNNPARLERLARAHSSRLGLAPARPEAFVDAFSIAFQPPPPRPPGPEPQGLARPRTSAQASDFIASQPNDGRRPDLAFTTPYTVPITPAAPMIMPQAPREATVSLVTLLGKDWLAVGLGDLPPRRPDR